MTSRNLAGSAIGEDAGALPSAQQELRISLPTRLLTSATIIACLFVAGAWSIACWLGLGDQVAFKTGMLGIGIVGIISILGIFVMSPWKQRAIADWMTMWLASTVFRVLVTPVTVFVLYSAASSSLAVKPLGLSVAVAYMATLFVEAAVLAGHLKRFCKPLSR